MYLLISNSFDPYFNLAAEEYLLRNSPENIVFLYRNKPCIVVGKHQNAMAEINYRFVYEQNIPVIRRISGGGTVFHDEGNFNFTFLQNGEEGNLVNFRAFISPIVRFLDELGIPAEIGPRNDILIDGLKVSGNAEHIFKKRTLHHGTLLYSSALANLGNALHTIEGKYTDRAVKSVRSKVTNIKDKLHDALAPEQFFNALSDYLSKYYSTSALYLPEEAISSILQSANSKYVDWDWNFGYSPDYLFKNFYSDGESDFSIELEVEKGIIRKAKVEGEFAKIPLLQLESSFTGQRHSFDDIIKILKQFESTEHIWVFF